MRRRLGRKLTIAVLAAGGGLLFSAQNTSCLTFTGETALAATDFCFIFDCQNGILGGTIDPCFQSTDAQGNAQPPVFADCP